MFNHIHKIVKGSTHKIEEGTKQEREVKVPEIMRYFKGLIMEQHKKGEVDNWLIKTYEDFYSKLSTKKKTKELSEVDKTRKFEGEKKEKN